MPYAIMKRGSKFCVVKKDGGKTFGCHPTREAAKKQLGALYAHTRDASEWVHRFGGGPGSGDFGHKGRPGQIGGSSNEDKVDAKKKLNDLEKQKEDPEYVYTKGLFTDVQDGAVDMSSVKFVSDGTWEQVDPTELIATQEHVAINKVKRFIESFPQWDKTFSDTQVANYLEDPDEDGPIIVIERKGQYFVADGHHRAAAAVLLDRKVKAFVVKEKSKRQRNAMEPVSRIAFIGLAGGNHRYETYDGTEYLVVPVVAMMEGVVRALGSKNPEYVKPQAYSMAPSSWNGRPVFLNHPLNAKGEPVSGNDPEVLKTAMGHIFNSKLNKSRLCMEAWVDEKKAKTKAQKKLVTRLKANEDVEVSLGQFVIMSDEEGEFDGKKYSGAWDLAIPDHLALLEEGMLGACSRKMGCGVRAAQGFEPTEFRAEGGKGSGDFGHKGRPGHLGGSAPKSGKASRGSNVRTPDGQIGRVVNDPVAVSDTRDFGQYIRVKTPDGTIHSLYQDENGFVHERSKEVMKKLSKRLDEGMHQIAPPDGESDIPDVQHEARKGKMAKKRSLAFFVDSALQYLGLQSSEDVGDMDLREKLTTALGECFPGMPTYNTNITMVYPEKSEFVYSIYGNGKYRYFQMDYEMDANGNVTCDDNSIVEVERVQRFEPIAEQESVTALRAACGGTESGHDCSCKNKNVEVLQPAPWDGHPSSNQPAPW